MSCGRLPDEDEDEDNPAMPVAEPKVIVCARCKVKSPVILIRASGYCHDCFMSTFQVKAKKGLDCARDRSRDGSKQDRADGIRRTSSDRSSVMLAFSGGQSSRVLLDLLIKCCPVQRPSSSAHFKVPRMFSKVEVVYIDESGVPGYGGIDRTPEIRTIVESSGFDFIPLKLEDVFASNNSLDVAIASLDLNSTVASDSTTTPLSKLLALLSPHTPTSRASLHSSMRNALLRRTAASRGHEILLTGETATRVAIKVLAGMAEGRGWNMGEEVGAQWETQIGDICLLQVRPLSLILAKEVSFYSHAKSLTSLIIPTPATGIPAKEAGIEGLTEEFVNGLEASFPSTVSTIIRTAGKLGMRTADVQQTGAKSTACPLCGLPAQVGAAEWRRANTISSLAVPLTDTPAAADSSPPSLPLASLLCYGCLLVYQGVQQSSSKPTRSSVVSLPEYVHDAAIERWEQERGEIVGWKKKEVEISEYLLE